MNQTVKWVLAVVVVALLAWGLTTMNKNQNENQGAGQTYKVGVMGPLTGDAAVYGEPLVKLIRAVIDDTNSKAPDNGIKLELVVEDGKCNGKDASNAMAKLV